MSAPDNMPYGPPALRELVVGLHDFFAEEVVPELDEPLRYHVRVAVGVLAVVARELELGPAFADAHRERLRAFGAGDDAELADAIRGGTLDDRFDTLRCVLLVDATERVAVANPAELAGGADA